MEPPVALRDHYGLGLGFLTLGRPNGHDEMAIHPAMLTAV